MAEPTIQFVVEDGTGVEDANTFITLEYAIQYWANHGYGSFDLDEDMNTEAAKQKAAIIRGSRWLSDAFNWAGIRKTERSEGSARGQGLAWPRIWVIDEDRNFENTEFGVSRIGTGLGYGGRYFGFYGIYGDWVDPDSVPEEIQRGTAEAAWYEYQTPHALAPTFIAAEREMSVSVGGGVGIRYKVDDVGPHNSRPFVHKVMDIVRGLLSEDGRSSRFGMAERG